MRSNAMLTLLLAGMLSAGVGCKNKSGTADDQANAVEAKATEAAAVAADKPADDKSGGAKPGAAVKHGDDAAAPTAKVGQPAPDFTLKDDHGKSHSLGDYRGKIVVLEWTNPGCPFVQRHYGTEHTMTETADAVGGPDKVAWMAVDSSHTVTPAVTKKSKEKWDFDHPVLQDPSGKVGKLYGAKSTPHMFVIDKKGVLRYAGAIDDDPRGSKPKAARTNYVLDAVQALKAGEDVAQKQTKSYGCSVKYGS